MRAQHENIAQAKGPGQKDTSAFDGLEGGLLETARPGEKQHQVQRAATASAGVQQLMAMQAAANQSGQVLQLKELQASANVAMQRKEGESKGGGGGLPAQLRGGIEQLSGVGMDGVQVHMNSSKPAQLQAHAYAQGNEIHVAPGQEKHLPHEAWHVAQQRQGRVQATTQVGGNAVNDDAGLEQEADVMGAKAMQMKLDDSGAKGLSKSTSQAPVQQMKSSQVMQLRGERITRGNGTGWGVIGWTGGEAGRLLWERTERKFGTELDEMIDRLAAYALRFPAVAALTAHRNAINVYKAAYRGDLNYANAVAMEAAVDAHLATGQGHLDAVDTTIDTALARWRAAIVASSGSAGQWALVQGDSLKPDLPARRDERLALRAEADRFDRNTATAAEIARIDLIAGTLTGHTNDDAQSLAFVNMVIEHAVNRDPRRAVNNITALRGQADDAQIRTLLVTHDYTTEAAIAILNLAGIDELITLLGEGMSKANILALYQAIGPNQDAMLHDLWWETQDNEEALLLQLIQLSADNKAELLALLRNAAIPSTAQKLSLLQLAGRENEDTLNVMLGNNTEAEVRQMLDTQSGRQNAVGANNIAVAVPNLADRVSLLQTQGVRGCSADVVTLLAHPLVNNHIPTAVSLLNKRGNGTDALTVLGLAGMTLPHAVALMNTTGIVDMANPHLQNLWTVHGIHYDRLIVLLNLRPADRLDAAVTAHDPANIAHIQTALVNGKSVWEGQTIAAADVTMVAENGAPIPFTVDDFDHIRANAGVSLNGAAPANGRRYAGNRHFANNTADTTTRLLPKTGVIYTEYDIVPFPTSQNGQRDLRRIVRGDNGRFFYSNNHYQDAREIV